MKRKLLIPLFGEEIAPRFDLASEVLTAECTDSGELKHEKLLILPGPSAEKLCHMIITEQIAVVICGGIEQEFYDYLTWKRVEVFDNVVGSSREVLDLYRQDGLSSGDIVRPTA